MATEVKNMITFEEAIAHVGGYPEPVGRKLNYRAYKDGECKIFDDYVDASKFSNLIEKFVVNLEEWTSYKKKHDAVLVDATKFWMQELKTEFNLSDSLFDVCYAEAWERGHSYGYDHISNCMTDVVSFVTKLQELAEQ